MYLLAYHRLTEKTRDNRKGRGVLIHIFENIGHEAGILLALAVILCAGFLVTRLTKLLHLPNVSGYIIAGILIGPHLLNVIPAEIADGMNFVADIALAFIAFGVGKFFKREVLRATGMRVVVITVMEALLAGVLVTAAMVFLFHFDWKLSLLLGAIATATAPASTVMTINQYHARGAFVNTLLQVVALDDVVCLLVFSIAAAVVNAADTGVFTAMSIVLPLLYNLAAIVLGAALAFVLAKLLRPGRSNDNRLILVIAMLLGLSGLCALFDISPLLSCMVFGAVYINKTDDRELYHQLNNFTPPIMSIFFITSGMKLDVHTLSAFGLAGVGYFVIRILGKYAGATLGCMATHADRETRRYLGAALVPQAGVAIGLAYLGERILPPHIGGLLVTIILSSSVLYELIGPACAKFALFRAGTVEGKEGRLLHFRQRQEKTALK